jgi:hypothetical protein
MPTLSVVLLLCTFPGIALAQALTISTNLYFSPFRGHRRSGDIRAWKASGFIGGQMPTSSFPTQQSGLRQTVDGPSIQFVAVSRAFFTFNGGYVIAGTRTDR